MNKECELLELTRNTFWLRQKINEHVGKEFHLSGVEVDILAFVFVWGDTATATNIERERKLKKNTISIHVDNLVRLGFLERKGKDDDRRAVNLLLTEKAKPIAQKCVEESELLRQKLFDGISQSELQIMHHLLEIINKNAKELLKK